MTDEQRKFTAVVPLEGFDEHDYVPEDLPISYEKGAPIKGPRGNIVGEVTHMRVHDGKIEVEGVLYDGAGRHPADGPLLGLGTSAFSSAPQVQQVHGDGLPGRAQPRPALRWLRPRGRRSGPQGV